MVDRIYNADAHALSERWRYRVQGVITVAVCAVIVYAAIVGWCLIDDYCFRYPHAAALRAMPRFEVATEPMTVTLRIEPAAQIAKSAPGAEAYARQYADPCVIVLPSGMPIEATPATGYAHFMRYDDADTIAHELLHCTVGSWHD